MSSIFSIKNELASRYGLALLEVAVEKGQLDAVQNDLETLAKMCKENAAFSFMLNCPTIAEKQKVDAILAIADKAKFSKTTSDFLGTVASNNRLFALPAMIDAFFALLAKRNGVVPVSVISAIELDKKQTDEITSALKKALGSSIALSLKVDARLLGGLMIKIGSVLIDSSLRSKVQQLKTVMKGA